MMTRKHYNKIADAIYEGFAEHVEHPKFHIASVITNALRGTNPSFDSQRFYNACMHGRGKKKRIKR